MRKQKPFVMIPEALGFDLHLKHVDLRVYFALRSYRNEGKRSRVYPSRSTIAERIGCHIATIDRAIKRLERFGYIEHCRGRKGQANSYQFLTDSSTDAAMSVALVQLDANTDARSVRSPMNPQPEPLNQTHKPEVALRLYHRNDIASVSDDGHIRIRIYTGQWVDYGGGDDDGFRFGNLRGEDARKAAIKKYANPYKH